MFNGSTSLRNAAGQLVENTVKSVRRGETVDAAYLARLDEDVTALYRLDQPGTAAASGKEELGPLPSTAAALLASLAGAWVLILAYLAVQAAKKKRISG